MSDITTTTQSKKHTLKIDSSGAISITGIENVNSVCDKEAIFLIEKQKLTVKGSGLNISKLDVGEGTVVLETKAIASVSYQGTASREKLTLKGLFK